jgi:hypothetical protein
MTTSQYAEPPPSRWGGGSRRSLPASALEPGVFCAPIGWLAMPGSLFVLLLAAFWDTPVHVRGRPDYIAALRRIFEQTCTARSPGARSGWRRSSIADAALAFRSHHGARRHTASPQPARGRRRHAPLGELSRQSLRLRTILSDSGALNWALDPLGISFDGYSTAGLCSSSRTLAAFMIPPIYAGLARIPAVLDASVMRGRSLGHALPRNPASRLPGGRRRSIFTFADPRRLHRQTDHERANIEPSSTTSAG